MRHSANSNNQNTIEKFVVPLFLLMFGVITYYTHDIFIAADLKTYMKAARSILDSGSLLGPEASISQRGPVFPFLIAISYYFLGVSKWSAFWVIRVFAILNPILIYYLGKKLYGRAVGLTAALLVTTSYGVFRWSYHHLDAIWPFFILLSLLVIIKGFEQEKLTPFVGGGILAGVAFLTKEVAILFFICPAVCLILIGDYRTRANTKGVVVYFVALIMTILPWLIYSRSALGGIEKVLGRGGPKVIEDFLKPPEAAGLSGIGLIEEYLKIHIKAFAIYYNETLKSWFMLAPLFLAAWSFVIVRSFQRDKANTMVLIYAVVFLPILWRVGYAGLRPGQTLIFYLLSFLVFSNMLWACFTARDGASPKDKKQERYPRYQKLLFSGVVLIIIILQIFVGSGGQDDTQGYKYNIRFKEAFIRSHLFQRVCRNNNTFVVRQDKDRIYARRWIKKNIPKETNVMWDEDERFGYYVRRAKIKHIGLPYVRLCDERSKEGIGSARNVILIESKEPSDYMNVLTEENLIKEIDEAHVEYVITGWGKHYLRLYFEYSSNFERLREFKDGKIVVYRVSGALKGTNRIKPFIDNRIVDYLFTLREKNDPRLCKYKACFASEVSWKNGVDDLLELKRRPISNNFVLGIVGRLYPPDKYPMENLLRK